MQRRDARKIETQNGVSKPDGPSRYAGQPSSSSLQALLPPQLEVNEAIDARKFEITALQRAIRSARSSSATRAWQLLPRHARRRAASHNVLRLPTRLRTKGLAEMRSSATTAKSRSEIRKRLATHPLGKGEARRAELRSRAGKSGQKWLENHLWLSKRFRMSRSEFDGDRWGYILPEEPSMKGERTDWRAANYQCALYDASWYQWIRLSVKLPKMNGSAKGKEKASDHEQEDMKDVVERQYGLAVASLDRILCAANIRASVSGGRIRSAVDGNDASVIDAVLHEGIADTCSDSAVCPLNIYLCPRAIPACGPSETSSAKGLQPHRRLPQAQQRHLRGLVSLLPAPPPQSEITPDAEILINVHPAAQKDVLTALKKGVRKEEAATQQRTQQRQQKEGEVAHDVSKSSSPSAHYVIKQLQLPSAATVVGDDKAQITKKGRSAAAKIMTNTQDGRCDEQNITPLLQTHLERNLDTRLTALKRSELRDRSFNTFELFGPQSGAMLGDILTLAGDTTPAALERWKSIIHEKSIAESAKQNGWTQCLSLNVYDPRLRLPATPARAKSQQNRKPTGLGNKPGTRENADSPEKRGKRKRPSGDEATDEASAKKVARTGATEMVDEAAIAKHAASSDRDRHTAPKRPCLLADGYGAPKFTKGTLDARRSALLIPGSKLSPTAEDDIVPIVIVPRPRRSARGLELSGYTLIVPQAWGRAFFHSLVRNTAKVRPLGLKGMRGLYREAGKPWYPDEWPSAPALGTSTDTHLIQPSSATAWESSVEFSANKAREYWLRRPPAKRINFEKLGVEWPFGGIGMWRALGINGNRILGKSIHGTSYGLEAEEGSMETVTSAGAGVRLMGSAALLQAEIRWASTMHAAKLADNGLDQGQQDESLSEIFTDRIRSLLLHDTASLGSRPSHAFVAVRLGAVSRGALTNGDEIHLLNDTPQYGRSPGVDLPASSATHVGSVTSGRFSLSRGKSCAMGLISTRAWIAAMALSEARLKRSDGAERAHGASTDLDALRDVLSLDDSAGNQRRSKAARAMKSSNLLKMADIIWGAEERPQMSEASAVELAVRSLSGGPMRVVSATLVLH